MAYSQLRPGYLRSLPHLGQCQVGVIECRNLTVNQASVTHYALSLVGSSGDRLNPWTGKRYGGKTRNFWRHELEGIDIPSYHCNIPK
ncbi:MAG: hypothetical protein HLUCCO16_21235 [Phormidium sp. OSCR]|nr:MAG: hypothetical protein HLUCCO16_21235 [Phormidium sp. OSCR]